MLLFQYASMTIFGALLATSRAARDVQITHVIRTELVKLPTVCQIILVNCVCIDVYMGVKMVFVIVGVASA